MISGALPARNGAGDDKPPKSRALRVLFGALLLVFLALAFAAGKYFWDFESHYLANRPHLLEAARETGLPPDLILALAFAESSFNEKAVSKRGAKGLLQLMPQTFDEQAKKLDLESPDPFDPETNALIGATYLKSLLDLYDGDVELALLAYNAGKTRLKKLREGKSELTGTEFLETLPPEWEGLRRYVKKIQAARKRYVEP